MPRITRQSATALQKASRDVARWGKQGTALFLRLELRTCELRPQRRDVPTLNCAPPLRHGGPSISEGFRMLEKRLQNGHVPYPKA